jgi:hypothetical protein
MWEVEEYKITLSQKQIMIIVHQSATKGESKEVMARLKENNPKKHYRLIKVEGYSS